MIIRKSVVFVILLFLFVTACSSGGGTKESQLDPSASKDAEPITLTFWAGTGIKNMEGVESPNYGDWEKEMAKRFAKLHPNVTIDVVSIPWKDIEQKVNVSVIGNNPPDILFDNVPMRVMKHARNGLLEELDDVIKDDRQDWKPSALATGSIGDKLYALSLYVQPSVILLNKTIFEQKGLTSLLPENRQWTWTQFKDALQQISGGDVYGTTFFAKNNQSDQINAAWLLSAGGTWANEDYSNYSINGPEGVEALEFMMSLMDEGLVAPGSASMQASDSIELFKQGKVAAIYDVPQVYGLVQGTDVQPYGIIPVYKDGVAPRMVVTGENGYALFKQTDAEKKKMAIEFIKFLTTADNVKAISQNAFGVPIRESAEYTIENDFGELIHKIEKLDKVDLGKSVPYYAQLREKFYPELQAAFLKAKTPQQALDDFVKAANELAAKK